VAHLDEGLDPGLAGRALGHDEHPDGLDRTVSRLRAAARSTAQSRSGGLDCIEGIGLAAATALLSVGSVDLDDFDAGSAQEARQPRSIRARALNADLGHVAEALEPVQQGLVAGGVGFKALRAEQPAERVEGCSHVNVEVRIDATGHTTRGFYDGHGHPFSQSVEGWHGRPGSERRAVWVVLATRTNHPNFETGRARFNVRLEGLGRRRFATSRDSKSDRTRQHSRRY
jgi:hypothetical protein